MRNEVTMSELPLMAEVWQETLQWQPSTAQQTQFQRLYELILEGNRQLNLTRITEPAEFWEKHLWDSLAGVAAWVGRSEELEVRSDELGANTPYPTPRTPHSKIIDIGTGAGFPGLPVAIARPDWHITLLDSTRKKVAFLETLVASLGLENVKTWCDRAEQIGQNRKHRETYDLALIRAVAPTSVCAEYALPLLKVGGSAILYRGQWTEEETQALQPALKQLGGEVESIEKFSTPLSQSLRHCLHLRKTNATAAEFPRLAGVPTQKPL